MEMPTISIIIPVYNASKTIRRALHSLTDNRYPIEIICVNDGSIDNSSQLIEEESNYDTRIILIKQENSGAASARNTGLKHTRGEYVMFCDADDEYDNETLKYIFEDIKLYNPDCIVFGRTSIFPDGRRRSWMNNKNTYVMPSYDWAEYFNNQIYKRGHSYVVYNRVYKASVIRKNEILFEEKLTLGEDLFFNILFMKHVLFLLEDGRAMYLQHKTNDSLTSIYRPNFYDDNTSVIDYVRLRIGKVAYKIQPFFDWQTLHTTELAVHRAIIGRDAHTHSEKRTIINKVLRNPEFYSAWSRTKDNIDPYMRKKIHLLIKHRVSIYAIRYIYLPMLREKITTRKV